MIDSRRGVLAGGLVLLALAIGIVLSRSPLTVAGTNSTAAHPSIAFGQSNEGACQEGETVPQGTSAMRLSLSANLGPSVSVKVFSGSRLVTSGQRPAGWGVQETVTVPIRRVAQPIHDARVCVQIGKVVEDVQINGSLVPTKSANGQTHHVVKLRIEYLRSGTRSWWSLASSVARRMGLGHAASGTWIVFALLACMIAVAVLASRLLLGELGQPGLTRVRRVRTSARPSSRALISWLHGRSAWAQGARWTALRGRAGKILARITPLRRLATTLRKVPRAAWICALIAFLNAACWSVITPPFQAPDEPSHFAYVQQLAETGTLPTSSEGNFSEEQLVAMRDLHQSAVQWHPEHIPIATVTEQRRLQHDLEQPLSHTGGGGAGVAAAQPPLYYALQTIPYGLGSGGTLLDQLALMRLLSALMGGLTALFSYLFVREALPRARWAWTIGGLGVALAPLMGFMSGVVNPDAMLAAVSAAIFYCLARGFRRGLTTSLAISIGVLTAIGFLVKLNFVGLAPGVVLGFVVLALRRLQRSKDRSYRPFALAAVAAAVPVCVYVVVNLLSNHPGLGIASGAINQTTGRGSALDEVSYIWQLFLPRLPGMANDFPGILTTHQIWFDRSIGLYGWLDTPFPAWVYNVALIPAALIAILAIRALVAGATALRHRLIELSIYAIMGIGLLALVGASSYLSFPSQTLQFGEARYLLPLFPLLGAVLALSARGAGRRWGPAAGTLIVVLFLAHDLFSQLQVIARFYG